MLITAFIQGAQWVYSKHDVVMSQNDELEAQITAIQQHEQGTLGIEATDDLS